MARILTTIHLSDIQKEVMAKVKTAPTEQVAWEEISNTASEIDQNFAAARDMLGDLGLLTIGDGELSVTDKGEEVMKDENLVDEMGELTDEGLALADTERGEHPPEGIEGFPTESLSLLRTIHEDAKAYEHMKKFKKN